jgi:chromosomal replication initiator protein
MPDFSPRELWSAVLERLQLEVSRHNYETWLKATAGLGLRDLVLTVGVPSEFIAQGLQRRMGPLIANAVREAAGADLEVRYQVLASRGGEAAPLGPPPGGTPPAGPHGARPNHTLIRGTPLNPAFTFDTFVVGKSNRFAHAAAMAVTEKPGRAYNPLFIHSGVGLGKTHLLHAIGNGAASNHLQVLYVSAEQFTNDFVAALRENRAEDFRQRYRSTDILLVDDIQFIAGKEHSRESFFHTFNDLHSANKQIVITSDSQPTAIPLMEERLRSRFEAGLVADIRAPELETRQAILEAKALQRGLPLPKDVAEFLARRVVRNVRELEGVLNRLVAMARISKQPLTLDLAQQALADTPAAPAKRNTYSPAAIVATVASYYKITPELLASSTRTKDIARARQVAAYLIREETTHSLADIGRLLGDRGHTTVLRAHEKIAAQIDVDTALHHEVVEIRSRLQPRSYSNG